MNKALVALVASVAFLAGDYLACVRANRRIAANRETIKEMCAEKRIAEMRVAAYDHFFRDRMRGVPVREGMDRLVTDLKYVDLIESEV